MNAVTGIHHLMSAPSPRSLASGQALLALAPSAPAVPPDSATEPFFERFLTSAGFGGLAALGAAIIAAWIAHKQLQSTRQQQRHDRWWETLGWVYDRAVVDAGKREALPHRVTFTMLSELAQQAQAPPGDRLQIGTIEAITSMFVPAGSDSPGDVGDGREPDASSGSSPGQEFDAGETTHRTSSLIEVSDPVAVDLMEALRARVQQSHEAPSSAQAAAYQESVRLAVARLLTGPGGRLAEVREKDDSVDFRVELDGRTVFVNAVYRPQSLLGHQVIEHLRKGRIFLDRVAPDASLVIVSNTIASIRLSHEANRWDPRLAFVVWRGEDDDEQLLEALLR
ncbi:hypothetical protein AB0F81_41725 [Actinoplanes sp. NPDC024001]|uniref:hypothetical protein n=1 Tax=Actinoplanes sp. NPDC024001 TaxID=3154598 RepID=UPI0033C32A3C